MQKTFFARLDKNLYGGVECLLANALSKIIKSTHIGILVLICLLFGT